MSVSSNDTYNLGEEAYNNTDSPVGLLSEDNIGQSLALARLQWAKQT